MARYGLGIRDFIEGKRAREHDDYAREDRALVNEGRQLGLENARREALYPEQVRSIMEKYQTETGQVEDAAGNVTEGRVPKKSGMTLADQLAMFSELGAHAFSAGKMAQKDFMELPSKVRAYKQEGIFDAISTMRNSGSVDEGIKAFNKLGGVKIKSYTEHDATDSLTGLPTKEIVIRTEDDKYEKVNLAELARDVGGAEKYLEWAKVGESARRTNVADDRNRLLERGQDLRHKETLEAIAQRDRAATGRANNPGRMSVFQQKRAAWLAVHKDDEEGALSYASGRRTLTNADARLAAERMAAGMKDDANMPLSARDRKAAAEEIYQRIIAEQGGQSPSTPRPAAGPEKPRRPLSEY